MQVTVNQYFYRPDILFGLDCPSILIPGFISLCRESRTWPRMLLAAEKEKPKEEAHSYTAITAACALTMSVTNAGSHVASIHKNVNVWWQTFKRSVHRYREQRNRNDRALWDPAVCSAKTLELWFPTLTRKDRCGRTFLRPIAFPKKNLIPSVALVPELPCSIELP